MTMQRVLASKIFSAYYRTFSTGNIRLSPSTYPYPLVRIPNPQQAPSFPEQEAQRSSLAALAFGAASNPKDPAGELIGWLKSVDAQIMPQNFIENRNFWPLVQQVLEKHAHEDPELQAQAAFQKTGWMNIMDGRNPPPLGRTGAAEDILGCVLIEDKMIQPKSFQANWAHRPVTRDGLFQLPKHLHSKLIENITGN